jgi:hypothetical protein
MKATIKNNATRQYKFYLVFMLIACGGAFIWQFFLPHLSGQYSSWGYCIGWQREIALWNIGIIAGILAALLKDNIEYMKVMTLQSAILCVLLGGNHLIALIRDFSLHYVMHIMGVFEVLLLGGVWGVLLLVRSRRH